MAAITPTTANNLLNALLRATSFTGPATVYLASHTADPGTTGASESTGGSYARQSITFAAASAGSAASSSTATFTNMPASTVTHVSVWDAPTAGNVLWSGALSFPKTLSSGDSLQFTAGQVTAALA